MDPVTAAGLVSNVLQLTVVARDIALTAKDLRRSKNGLSQDAERYRMKAELVRKSLVTIIETPSTSPADSTIREYAESLRTCADEYLLTLENMRIKGARNWSTAWRAAFRCWWRKEELEARLVNIEQAGTQFATYIITSHIPTMSSSIDSIQQDNLRRETDLNKKMEELLTQARGNNGTMKGHGKDVPRAIQEWFENQKKAKTQRQCLQAIYFPQIENRENEVKDAHIKTFGWILEDPQPAPDSPQKSNFKQWLQSQDQDANVFWVSGKPGSGKSTLMKYLLQPEKLCEHLEEWVGDRQLIVTACFFWRHGTRLQRSLTGLLRSLLYHILSKHPELVSFAFPNREWLYGGDTYEFPRRVLENGLERVAKSLKGLKMRLFVMIDGLDEFDDKEELGPMEHDQYDLVKLLSMFCSKDDVKLCVSSRPLPIFKQEYGQDPSRCICMQDVTANDIRIYISEGLESNTTFQSLAESDHDYANLVDEIVYFAHGVFLWVRLAVRSLLQGITNDDRVSTLKMRLRKLPRELHDLFQHMLDSIDPIYKKTSALMLLAYLDGSRFAKPPLFYHFMEDNEYTAFIQTRNIGFSQLVDLHYRVGKRINAYCQGLLEYREWSITKSRINRVKKKQLLYTDVFFDGSIQPCHRSVSEFLTRPGVRQFLIETAGVNSGQLNLLYCRSCLAVFQAIFGVINEGSKVDSDWYFTTDKVLIDIFMQSADYVEASVIEPLRREFETLLIRPISHYKGSLINHFLRSETSYGDSDFSRTPRVSASNILAFMIFYNIGLEYVVSKLRGDPKLIEPDECGCTLLDIATTMPRDIDRFSDVPLVPLLLELGSDPNRSVFTPWQRLLTADIEGMFSENKYFLRRKQGMPFFCDSIAAFIRHGADLDAVCYFIGFPTHLLGTSDVQVALYNVVLQAANNLIQGASLIPPRPGVAWPQISLPTGAYARYLYRYHGMEPSEELNTRFQNYADPEELQAFFSGLKKKIDARVEEYLSTTTCVLRL